MKLPKNFEEKQRAVRLFVVLERAALSTVKTGGGDKGGYQLLNCDDHQHIIKKNKKNPADFRPDITHQVEAVVLEVALTIAVLDDAPGFATEQGGQAAGLHSHRGKCSY